MITPINQHVLIQPLAKNTGVMSISEKNYDEKGIALSTMEYMDFKVGDTVYFDSWQAARYNEDTSEEFWLVPFSAIRAYEA